MMRNQRHFGILQDILMESGMLLSSQLRAFFQFHVSFTVRRILYQMGGIQSVSALPGDPTFNQPNNIYDIASYKGICAEFRVEPTADFRFIHGANHGLGNVFRYISRYGPASTGMAYPSSHANFSIEGAEPMGGPWSILSEMTVP